MVLEYLYRGVVYNMLNQILPYVNAILVLTLFIGVPVFIAVINANYVKDEGENVQVQNS